MKNIGVGLAARPDGLPEPFYTPEQLRRWNLATTDLYRDGLARPAPPISR